MGGGKKNTHGCLVIADHMCNPLCTNLSFPRAVGEDTVNTWCRDSDFFSNCRAWNTARVFKDRFHFFHMAFICRRCWCSTARSIICLFPAIPLRTCNTLEYFHPTKHEILLMFWRPSARNFRIVFPSIWHHKQCTFVTAGKVPLEPHTWFEFSHGAAGMHKTFEMTHVHVPLE